MVEIHAVNFPFGEQARQLTAVLSSVTAQELASSIADGSPTAQQGPQRPHPPENFVDLSGGGVKQGASRKCGSSNGCAMVPLLGNYLFCFLYIYSWKADMNNLYF